MPPPHPERGCWRIAQEARPPVFRANPLRFICALNGAYLREERFAQNSIRFRSPEIGITQPGGPSALQDAVVGVAGQLESS